jgi:hypothetical protein
MGGEWEWRGVGVEGNGSGGVEEWERRREERGERG